MTAKEIAFQKIKNNDDLFEEIFDMSKVCPGYFDLSVSFIEAEQYACTRGCYNCWNRTEKEIEKDRLIWEDYKKTDFNITDHAKWLKKWKIK